MFRRHKKKSDVDEPTENLLDVLKSEGSQPVAKVVLNGYNIEQSQSLGRHGAMCSFKIIKGNLWNEWSAQDHLILRTQAGDKAVIKITALPVEADSYGLIEFI